MKSFSIWKTIILVITLVSLYCFPLNAQSRFSSAIEYIADEISDLLVGKNVYFGPIVNTAPLRISSLSPKIKDQLTMELANNGIEVLEAPNHEILITEIKHNIEKKTAY